MSFYLTEDAYSITRSELLYAKAGALVNMIADYGNVLIVEGEDKVRFPVLRSFLSENPISDEELKSSAPRSKTVSATPRRKRSAPPGPNNLFNS